MVVLSNNQCRDTNSKYVRVYAQPKAAFETLPNAEVCYNFHVFEYNNQSSIAEGTLSATWDLGDGASDVGDKSKHSYAIPGSYTVKINVVSNYGCTDNTSKVVTIYPSPLVAFTPSKLIFCEGDVVDFSNGSVISSGNLSHNWDFGQGLNSTVFSPSSSYSQFGKYNVLLISTSDKGCNDSALQEIEAASIPLPSFLINPPQGCAGQTEFEFNSTSKNPDGRVMVYTWNFGDNTSLNSGAMAKHTYKFANNYGVKLTTASAICASEVIQNVSVVPGVNADFIVEKISPETRRFIALDTLTKGYTYFWNFGDGTTGYGAKATHMYKDNAPYNPVLVVFNSLDCSDTSDQNIDILSPNYKEQKNPLNFYVYPNPTTGSFVYKFEILEKRTVKVQIYDIVGQKPLFTREWTDMEPGTYYETVNLNEMNLSAGTYPFKITSQNDNLTLKIIYTGGE
jgi:PKD repeat protein